MSALRGNVRPVSEAAEADEYAGTVLKKHRHDLGHEDHGPKIAAGTTRAIQIILGLWIALTLVFVVYALIDMSRPNSPAAETQRAE
jgi:hypothetical protein